MSTSAIEGEVDVKDCFFYGNKGNSVNTYGNSTVSSCSFDSCFIAIKTALSSYNNDTTLIDSCNIQYAGTGSIGVSSTSGGSNSFISVTNTIINHYESGIFMNGINSFIDDCLVSFCKVGIHSTYGGLTTINNCQIMNNSDIGVQVYGACKITNCFLDSNKISIHMSPYIKGHIDSNIILHSEDDAVIIDITSDSITCSNNQIKFGKKNGIEITSYGQNLIAYPLLSNNTIQNFDSAGIFHRGDNTVQPNIAFSNISGNKYGIKSYYSNLKISDCDIYSNKFGVFSTGAVGDLEIDNCKIYLNKKNGIVLDYGGTGSAHANIINTEIANNTDSTLVGGAGVYINTPYPTTIFSPLNIIHSSIHDNFSKGSGGGIYSDAPLTIQNSIIANNRSEITSSGGGGGVYLGKYGGKIYNTVFANNSAFKGGGAVTIDNSTSDSLSRFSNCTFYNNTTFDFIGAGAIANDGTGSNIIRNSIFWDNKQGTDNNVITSDINLQSANNMIQKSMLQLDSLQYSTLGLLQQNMYRTNPDFYDVANVAGADNTYGTNDDGLHLTTVSPCVNIGVNGWAEGNYDASNNARIQQNIVDFGAYEGALHPLSIDKLDLDASINIYPNPTQGLLHLINSSSIPVVEINIYDLIGQKVMIKKDRFDIVDVKNLTNGVYIIEIITHEKSFKMNFTKD